MSRTSSNPASTRMMTLLGWARRLSNSCWPTSLLKISCIVGTRSRRTLLADPLSRYRECFPQSKGSARISPTSSTRKLKRWTSQPWKDRAFWGETCRPGKSTGWSRGSKSPMKKLEQGMRRDRESSNRSWISWREEESRWIKWIAALIGLPIAAMFSNRSVAWRSWRISCKYSGICRIRKI